MEGKNFYDTYTLSFENLVFLNTHFFFFIIKTIFSNQGIAYMYLWIHRKVNLSLVLTRVLDGSNRWAKVAAACSGWNTIASSKTDLLQAVSLLSKGKNKSYGTLRGSDRSESHERDHLCDTLMVPNKPVHKQLVSRRSRKDFWSSYLQPQ